jgi:hypothetical protein
MAPAASTSVCMVPFRESASVGAGQLDRNMPRRAYHPRTSIGIAPAFEDFQQKKKFLRKHEHNLRGRHCNSLRWFRDGLAVPEKWFREDVGTVSSVLGLAVEVRLVTFNYPGRREPEVRAFRG